MNITSTERTAAADATRARASYRANGGAAGVLARSNSATPPAANGAFYDDATDSAQGKA